MRALLRLARFFCALAGELSDETAYKRFLAFHGREPSREEWLRFSEQRFRIRYTRAKCC
jgi:hypothetical protein